MHQTLAISKPTVLSSSYSPNKLTHHLPQTTIRRFPIHLYIEHDAFVSRRSQTNVWGRPINRSFGRFLSVDWRSRIASCGGLGAGYADAVPDLARTETWRVLQVRMGIGRILGQVALGKLPHSYELPLQLLMVSAWCGASDAVLRLTAAMACFSMKSHPSQLH